MKDLKYYVFHDLTIEEPPASQPSSSFWRSLTALGTELWLDTGNIEAIQKFRTPEFSGLTTNNTLLNREIQKGIYDDYIRDIAGEINGRNVKHKIRDIAFIINARHGLKLAKMFNCKVSVELHTDLAHDVELTVDYAEKFYEICPDSFLIKVPFTPAGLIASKKLSKKNIPINMTLGFSARQNYLAAEFCRVRYVNVFLGRLNAYFLQNNLGDGKWVGEKAVLDSQKIINEIDREEKRTIRQIAASFREEKQLADLSGVDVFTVPPIIAEKAKANLTGRWENKLDFEYPVHLNRGVYNEDLNTMALWNITGKEHNFIMALEKFNPANEIELVELARANGLGEMFPILTDDEINHIRAEGKIPNHKRWAHSISTRRMALDSILNIAGLYSFAADQRDLDERIKRIIEK